MFLWGKFLSREYSAPCNDAYGNLYYMNVDKTTLINPSHPLKALALDCLNDKDAERPSAEELRRHAVSLKQNHKYHKKCESMRRPES